MDAKLDQAKADTQKSFGGGKAVGATTEQCYGSAAVKVVIVTMQPVACPGHDFDIRCLGEPAGGTYKWTVSGGGASLVDIGGNPTNVGTRLFLRSLQPNNKIGIIPPRRVRVSVTYTHPKGIAKATKRIIVHGIRFRVQNSKVRRGLTQAHENLNPGGVVIWNSHGLATMATHPKIQIILGKSCPRKAACAQNNRVGWLQTLRGSDRRGRYRHTRVTPTVPLPIRDAMAPYPPIPWYAAPSNFTGDRDKITAHHIDSPRSAYQWVDPRVPSPANPIPVGQRQLRRVRFRDTFTAWLVVQNVEWSGRDLDHSFVFLKHFDWKVAYDARVNVAKAITSRVRPRRLRPFIGALYPGKGSRNPILTAPVPNTSVVVNVNPAPAIP